MNLHTKDAEKEVGQQALVSTHPYRCGAWKKHKIPLNEQLLQLPLSMPDNSTVKKFS